MTEEYGTRYMCGILENMRALCRTLNFSYLPALIEEAQYRAERMENAIEAYSDLTYMEKKRVELKAEIKELKKQKENIESTDKG